MKKSNTWKYVVVASAALILLCAGALLAANKFGKPASVVHVVTLYWKDGTTDAQKQAVWDATTKMAGEVKGLKNVWLKSVKVQGKIGDHDAENAFVMEFVDAKAFEAYANDPAHKAWEKVYLAVRGESRTFDITN